MKKLIFIFLAFATMQWSFAQNPIIKNVGNFTSLSASNAVPITLVASPDKTVEISGNGAELVEVKNNNGNLMLRLSNDCHSCDVKVIVNYTILNNIQTSSAASVKGTGIIKASNLSLNASSAGSITLNIEAQKLSVDASSAGMINLSGTVDYQKADVSSAAQFSAKDLHSKQTDVTVSGAAKAIVYATETVNANVSSAGNVDVYGNPNTKNNTSREYVPGHIKW
ncbi:MAG: DUF2807 domain-containing protein [Chitinophagaceae bacterium]|jgi:Fe-S cluster biogenesis protein NfuA|nr:DUF2807 domain-containing protein [Chitinophagaceae bacterium]